MATPTIKLLAGEFPPGLNTAAPDTDLTPGETPDSYGFDLSVDGKIKTGSVPTGTSRVQKQAGTAWVTGTAYIVDDVVTNSSTTYICLVAHTSGVFATDLAASKWVAATIYWHGQRLWRLNSGTLEMSAKNYDDHFFKPATRLHKIPYTEDGQSLLAILPIEPDALFVTKSTGGYMIRNISDTRGFFQVSDLIQEMAAGAANRAIAIGNVVYVGNATDGIQSYENFKTTEVSRKIRPTRATVGALAMTADYERKQLILGSSYVYDIAADKWFNFTGSSFRYTTRRLRNPDWSPFSVQRVIFAIEHGDTTNGVLKYQLRHETSTWGTVMTVNLPYQSELYTTVSESLLDNRSSRKWQMRITSLSSGKYIRQIMMETEDYEQDDYGE